MKHTILCAFILLMTLYNCSSIAKKTSCDTTFIYTTSGKKILDTNKTWLTHEHTLVDFIGADKINPDHWKHDSVIKKVLPFLKELSDYKVDFFVDATLHYIGRDVLLLDKIAKQTGLKIVTNTGFYGARNNKYIPEHIKKMTPAQIANIWVNEYANGIEGTEIRPGFIKIGVDENSPLLPMHKKLIEAAAITHLKTGLTIASHTGKAIALWPQLDILKDMGVSNNAFIWVHANQEQVFENFLKAAQAGCWISLDGLGWEIDNHIDMLLFAKEENILDRVLISHDAGWYDPQKTIQNIQPYTTLFEAVIPKLKSKGFTSQDIDLLLKVNPAKAFSIKKRPYSY